MNLGTFFSTLMSANRANSQPQLPTTNSVVSPVISQPMPNPRNVNVPLPISRPQFSNVPLPMSKPTPPKPTFMQNLGRNLRGFVQPQDDLQRRANLAFATKLMQSSRPQLGSTNKGLGATLGNIGSALEARQDALAPDIRQLGNVLIKINPDGSVEPLYDPNSDAEKEPNTLSNTLQKAETTDLGDYNLCRSLIVDAREFIKMIDTGKLTFGVLDRVGDFVENIVGGTEESINSNQFRTFLQRLRNAQLRLNKGVQTEGDAKRAMQEMIDVGDTNNASTIRAGLVNLQNRNEVHSKWLENVIQQRRKAQNVPPFDFSELPTPAPTVRAVSEQKESGSSGTANEIEFEVVG